MPITRKQKSKVRKSREADILSDIENMDILLGFNHFEREEGELISNSVRRPESPGYNALVNRNQNRIPTRENEIRGFASLGHNSGRTESSCDFNRLSMERPERRSEKTYSQKVRSSSRSELPRNLFCDEDGENTHNKTIECFCLKPSATGRRACLIYSVTVFQKLRKISRLVYFVPRYQ